MRNQRSKVGASGHARRAAPPGDHHTAVQVRCGSSTRRGCRAIHRWMLRRDLGRINIRFIWKQTQKVRLKSRRGTEERRGIRPVASAAFSTMLQNDRAMLPPLAQLHGTIAALCRASGTSWSSIDHPQESVELLSKTPAKCLDRASRMITQSAGLLFS